MATLLGEYGMDRPAFHDIIYPSSNPYVQHNSDHHRSNSHTRTPSYTPSPPAGSARPREGYREPFSRGTDYDDKSQELSSGRTSQFPTPPDSSSPSGSSIHNRRQDVRSVSAETRSIPSHLPTPVQSQSHAADLAEPVDDGTGTQSDQPNAHLTPAASVSQASRRDSQTTSQHTLAPSASSHRTTQRTTRVRDLAHIESLARADLSGARGGGLSGILDERQSYSVRYEISDMPIGDIIEMVAALLTKITTTNDQQHDRANRSALDRNATHARQAQAQNDGSVASSELSPMSSSVLAFHGKNVPAITILSYLSRIHKYCPTTYEVFLSLLVYFDRMTERVNDMIIRAEEQRHERGERDQTQEMEVDMPGEDLHDDDDSSVESDEDLADDDDEPEEKPRRTSAARPAEGGASAATGSPTSQPTYFVVDNFNIHRLIIAGVTCASKFFSDVFYTNSRYAKVGGLPLAELNHLELQFLLLNDFRLAIPVEDLEAYATMLVEFYAREVVAHGSQAS